MRNPALLVLSVLSAVVAQAQHLWWDSAGREQDVCLYGEITVLETSIGTYFCGANWHPGEPAGGYCGIQNTDAPEMRLTICSVWDTAEGLAPTITYQMPDITVAGAFGGEGTGAQTLNNLQWKVGETFRFYARKQPGAAPDTTDLLYYYHDNVAGRWVHMSTITNPNGGQGSVTTLTNLASFLENYLGRNRSVARLALYRLWSGKDVDHLTCIRGAVGDGTWGQLGGAYFLADGSRGNLDKAFRRWRKAHGSPRMPTARRPLGPIPDQPLTAATVAELRALQQ